MKNEIILTTVVNRSDEKLVNPSFVHCDELRRENMNHDQWQMQSYTYIPSTKKTQIQLKLYVLLLTLVRSGHQSSNENFCNSAKVSYFKGRFLLFSQSKEVQNQTVHCTEVGSAFLIHFQKILFQKGFLQIKISQRMHGSLCRVLKVSKRARKC